jgi:hypothetical protein
MSGQNSGIDVKKPLGAVVRDEVSKRNKSYFDKLVNHRKEARNYKKPGDGLGFIILGIISQRPENTSVI